MISIVRENNYDHVVVLGEFSLQDFREFEQCVIESARSGGAATLLVDLQAMSGYTIDMALEEIKFAREHRHEIARIALVSNDQWVAWSAWLSRIMTEADIEVFDEMEEALSWITQQASAATGVA